MEGRINILLAEIEKYKKKLYDDKCADAREPDTASQLGQFAPFETLTREMVEAFVEQVYICQDSSLRIQWKSYGNGNRVKSAWREKVGLALLLFCDHITENPVSLCYNQITISGRCSSFRNFGLLQKEYVWRPAKCVKGRKHL